MPDQLKPGDRIVVFTRGEAIFWSCWLLAHGAFIGFFLDELAHIAGWR